LWWPLKSPERELEGRSSKLFGGPPNPPKEELKAIVQNFVAFYK